MRFAAVLLGSLLVAACGSTATSEPTPPFVPSTIPAASTASATSSASVASSSPAGASVPAVDNVPDSCQALLVVLTPYTGDISATQSLGKPQHLSCEYQYDSGKGVIIVNIGAGGTMAAYDALKAGTASGGRKASAVPNLGAAAFSVSKGGKPAGVTSLGTNGILYVIEGNLLFTQDIGLIRDLMRLH